jgi:hypothetical protein
MVLGTIYTYITDRGQARAAICIDVQGSGVLHVFLTSGDDQYAQGPYLVVQNVPNDPTGALPNSYH